MDLNRAAQAIILVWLSVGVRGDVRDVLRPEWGFLRFGGNPNWLAFLPERMMAYLETFVPRNQHRIYVRDHPGAEPAIILMHGFPDNIHLYDRLVPYLSPHAESFSLIFLGGAVRISHPAILIPPPIKSVTWMPSSPNWGLSKSSSSRTTPRAPAIDWALDHPERVAGLVLLNTYYCEMPTLRRPEAIWLFSTPVVRSIARPVSQMFGNWIFRRMYWWQVGRFIRDADVRREFVPLLYQQFDATPSARPAFFRLNEDLLPMVRSHTEKIPRLGVLGPVRIIFGDADYTLNSGVAGRSMSSFLSLSYSLSRVLELRPIG